MLAGVVTAFKGSRLNFSRHFALRLVMQPQSCRTSLLLVIILICCAAAAAAAATGLLKKGGGRRGGGHAGNLLKGKWTWMSGRGEVHFRRLCFLSPFPLFPPTFLPFLPRRRRLNLRGDPSASPPVVRPFVSSSISLPPLFQGFSS